MDIRTAAMFLVLSGCGKAAAPAFGGDGERRDLPEKDDGGDDTGPSGGGEGDPTVIDSASGSWAGENFLINISVTDPDDNIDQGKVGYTVDDLDELRADIIAKEEGTDSFDGAVYYPDEDKVSVFLDGIESSGPTPTIMVRIWDSEMNASESIAVSIADW